MFSLLLLEASLPHLVLARFSAETSEEFKTLISDTRLAVCEVKPSQGRLDGMPWLSVMNCCTIPALLVDTQTDCLDSPNKWCFRLYW